MNLYTLALFVHVSGAIGTFVSLGIWLFGLSALRRAKRVEQVRALAWLIIVASPLMVVSVLAGFAMALTTWGLLTPWIAVSLVIVVLIGPIGALVLDPRMRIIFAEAQATPDGPLPDRLNTRTHDPILGSAASTLTTLLFGIVFLMTTKPELITAILVMGIALFIGFCISLPFWKARWRRARQPGDHLPGAEADPSVPEEDHLDKTMVE